VEIANKWISGIIKEVIPGEVYQGLVKRILPFGAFVEILPGKEGMVHVSQMSTEFVSDPSAVVQIGQQVTVRVVEIDQQGRINLSMLFGEDAKKRPLSPRPQRNVRHERRFDRPRRRF
jgi:polyribonucleotide nucleotidyltransferase